MAVTIKANHQWRHFAYRADVPEDVLKDQFYHLDPDDALDGFFCYRGHWYHLSDFMRLSGPTSPGFSEDLPGWHGYHSDSMFSGVVIKVSADGERYQAGTYFS
jgi:hypothetical protein